MNITLSNEDIEDAFFDNCCKQYADDLGDHFVTQTVTPTDNTNGSVVMEAALESIVVYADENKDTGNVADTS